jgi:hypothetical protein
MNPAVRFVMGSQSAPLLQSCRQTSMIALVYDGLMNRPVRGWSERASLVNLAASYGKLPIASAGAAFKAIAKPFERIV